MGRPSPDELYAAAEWLRCHDEDGSEVALACERVANWLEQQAGAAEERAEARDLGVPVERLRRALGNGGAL